MRMLPPLRLTGAIILRDGELRQRSVAIIRGRIAKGPLPAVDLSGYLILPGIVDMLAEIPPASMDAAPAPRIKRLRALAAACGITTLWAVAPWSWAQGLETHLQATALIDAIRAENGPIDMRPALRVEVGCTETGPALLNTLEALRPSLVYFQATHDALAELRQNDPAAFALSARDLGMTSVQLFQALQQVDRRAIPRHLCRIAEVLDAIGAIYGSLDDKGGDVRETYSMLGASLAACPASYSAAAAGHAMGSPVLLEPTAVPTASQILREGICSAFVSRGQPEALARRVLRLAGPDLVDLPRCWAMLSSNPAEIMRLADRGTLDYGRRADLVVIRRDTLQIEATIAAGQLVFIRGEAMARFRQARTALADRPIAAE